MRPGWAPLLLWVLFGALLALMLWMRPLGAEEARWFVETDSRGSILNAVHEGWELWAGSMLRAARSSNFFLVWLGLGFLALARRRLQPSVVAMSAALIFPATLGGASSLGSGALFFGGLAALAALIVRLGRGDRSPLSARGALAITSLIAAALPWLAAQGTSWWPAVGTADGDWTVFRDYVPGAQFFSPAHSESTSWAKIPNIVWPCLFGALISFVFASRRGLALAFAALGTLPFFGAAVAIAFNPEVAAHLSITLPAALVPLALAISDLPTTKMALDPADQSPTNRDRASSRWLIPAFLCVLLAINLAGEARNIELRTDPAAPLTQTLDWVTYHVDQEAPLLLLGPDRHLLRYFEVRGHDTGRRALIVDSDETLREMARRADFFDLPQIALVGATKTQRELFLPRHREIDAVEGQPQALSILSARSQ